jgi:hypothetical protein
MANKITDPGPLDWRVSIVDKAGRPSPEFQRRWNTNRDNTAQIGTVTFGSGAPTGVPDDGAVYVDTSVSPAIVYYGDGGTWLVATPTPGDPTATAGATANDGTASTFMRSDASPAVQIGTTAEPGLLQPDGTTITVSAGVISAVGGGGGGGGYMLPLVTGDLSGPVAIADAYGQFIGVPL